MDSGSNIISNQVQFSIIDRRPEVKLLSFCQRHNVSLLAYGSICGGLISERYLGKSEPSNVELNTLSLRKYKKMIDAWGGWNLFQDLLTSLKRVGQKHGVSIAKVATSYILKKPQVGGVIIGARLGIVEHISDNTQVFGFILDKSDQDEIDSICENANDLFEIIGDCGDEYR
jgi:aryl-alcohol dehydrogenase-like predicted oxidoreductase